MSQKYALNLVEGDTEIIFYKKIKELYFSSARSKVHNLKGNWNINQKVLDYVSRHAEDHAQKIFSILICIDRESRSDKAPIDMEVIKKGLSCYANVDLNSVLLFEATQDIESWFFHDIDGIYRFLRAPRAQRNPSAFRPVEKLNHQDMSTLFRRFKKEYRKGNASQNFIDSLDFAKIRAGSGALESFCTFMETF